MQQLLINHVETYGFIWGVCAPLLVPVWSVIALTFWYDYRR